MERLAGGEAGMRSAEEADGAGEFLGRAFPPRRNGAGREMGGCGAGAGDSTGGHAIHSNVVRRQLNGERSGQTGKPHLGGPIHGAVGISHMGGEDAPILMITP